MILVVSFGTSYNSSREITIGAVEKAVADACPLYEVRRAFTSQTVINILKNRDGLEIDNVSRALERAEADGARNLVVQPTYIMKGFEYRDLMEKLNRHKKNFIRLSVGMPLLSGDEDFKAVAKAVADHTRHYDDGKTAVIFMGHGTEAEANQVYGQLQKTLADSGFDNYYIGTVEAGPTVEEVANLLRAKGIYRRVVLNPLMLVAGDHAVNDMAGDKKDSWKNIFLSEGYEVECVLRSLGEMEEVRDIYVNHVLTALKNLG